MAPTPLQRHALEAINQNTPTGPPAKKARQSSSTPKQGKTTASKTKQHRSKAVRPAFAETANAAPQRSLPEPLLTDGISRQSHTGTLLICLNQTILVFITSAI